jgi:hypothetical protein
MNTSKSKSSESSRRRGARASAETQTAQFPLTIAYEDISPALAKIYLDLNRSNRTIRQMRVNLYARKMTDGRWRLTHQGIAFGADGELYDGQHRLLAVIQSGKTVRMLVIRGLPREAREEIDTGKTRSAADNLTITDGEFLGCQHGAWLGALYAYTELNSQYTSTVGAANLRAMRDRYREGFDEIRRIFHAGPRGVGRAGFVAAFIFAYAEAPKRVVELARQFRTGLQMNEGDPMFALRNRAQSDSRLKHSGMDDFRRALGAIAAGIDGVQNRTRVIARSATALHESEIYKRFEAANARFEAAKSEAS